MMEKMDLEKQSLLQCKGMTKKNERCKIKCNELYNGYCHMHKNL